MFDIKYEPLHQILLSQPHAQIHHSNLYVIQSKPNKCVKYCFSRPATKSKSPFKYVLPTIFLLFGIYNDHW